MPASYTFTIDPGGSEDPIQLPLPAQDDGIQMEYFPIGVAGRTANGTHRVQHVTSKWRVRVVWRGLGADERAIVWSMYGTYLTAPMAITFPDGKSFTGYVDLGSWIEAAWHDPHQNRVLYNVSFVIIEA